MGTASGGHKPVWVGPVRQFGSQLRPLPLVILAGRASASRMVSTRVQQAIHTDTLMSSCGPRAREESRLTAWIKLARRPGPVDSWGSAPTSHKQPIGTWQSSTDAFGADTAVPTYGRQFPG
jgi:hypothetical protein